MSGTWGSGRKGTKKHTQFAKELRKERASGGGCSSVNRWVGVWPDVEPGAQSRGPNEEGLEGHPKGVSFHPQSNEQPPEVQTGVTGSDSLGRRVEKGLEEGKFFKNGELQGYYRVVEWGAVSGNEQGEIK